MPSIYNVSVNTAKPAGKTIFLSVNKLLEIMKNTKRLHKKERGSFYPATAIHKIWLI